MGKKTTKTSSTSTPWAPAQPILTGAGNQILSTVQGNQGNLNNIEGSLTGGVLPGLQSQIQTTNQQLQPGFNYINSMLNPGFLQNGQAQAQALANYAGQQAGNSINSAFSAAGRTGSGNNVTDTARGVTQAELQPMLQNLQYNEGIQQQAAGMLPGMTGAAYQGYTPLFQGTQLAGQLPYYGATSLGNIGGLFSGYGTQTGTQPGGWGTDLLNAAAMAGSAALMHSDRRVKRDIIKVGEFPDGLGVYEYNYRDGLGLPANRFRGVMADEVATLRPWALGPIKNGFATVDYAALWEAV